MGHWILTLQTTISSADRVELTVEYTFAKRQQMNL
jgi:hypothetical protein